MEVTEIRKRKSFTMKQRSDILNELRSSDMSITALARKHEIHPVTIHGWKRKMSHKSLNKKSNKDSNEVDYKEILRELEALKTENDNLKKALGEVSVDNQILKTYNDVLKKSYREAKLKKRKK